MHRRGQLLGVAVALGAPVLSLQWSLPLIVDSFRSGGAFDALTAATLAPVLLVLAALPGYAAEVLGRDSRWPAGLRIASLLAMLAGSLGVAFFISLTFALMWRTLAFPAEILLWLLPPLTTAAQAVILRSRLTRRVAAAG